MLCFAFLCVIWKCVNVGRPLVLGKELAQCWLTRQEGPKSLALQMEMLYSGMLDLPYDPATPLLGIYPEKMKTLIQKDTCTPVFIAALFTVVKTWKQPKCASRDEWIKMWYIYTMEYYSYIKKNKMTFAATWTDLEIIILSEVSQRNTDIMWYHLYVESKKMIQMNLFTTQK